MRTKMIAAVFAGALAAAAFASPEHGGHGAMMEKLDANKDGAISRAEADAAKAERFARVDANKDGAVTQDEMRAHHEARKAEHAAKRAGRMGEHFAKMDKNGDGRLTQDEFGGAGRMFEHLDSNKDGSISADERAKMREHRRMKRQG